MKKPNSVTVTVSRYKGLNNGYVEYEDEDVQVTLLTDEEFEKELEARQFSNQIGMESTDVLRWRRAYHEAQFIETVRAKINGSGS